MYVLLASLRGKLNCRVRIKFLRTPTDIIRVNFLRVTANSERPTIAKIRRYRKEGGKERSGAGRALVLNGSTMTQQAAATPIL
jgi:hypothetical protein